jgi:hypothetical protein
MNMSMDLLYGPLAVVATTALSLACTSASRYLSERAHASRMARIVDCLGRIAADTSVALAAAPQGSDLASLKRIALVAGVADAKARIPSVIATCALSDETLTGMLSGEVSKIATSSVPGSVATAAAVVAASPVAVAAEHELETVVAQAAAPVIAAEDAVAPTTPGLPMGASSSCGSWRIASRSAATARRRCISTRWISMRRHASPTNWCPAAKQSAAARRPTRASMP